MARHLSFQERRTIARLIKARWSRADIAEVLGRSRSTISRELKRNMGLSGYRPQQAHRMAKERREGCRRTNKMFDPVLCAYVQQGLLDRWSPDQIAGASKKRFRRQPAQQISRQTIYNWIGQQGADESRWRALLRRGVPRLEKRGKLAGCVSIRGRPKIVNRRLRYGDWEGDTVVGKKHHGGILTTVERKSGYLRMAKLDNLKAETVLRRAQRKLGNLPPSLRRTMTFDNGPEFAYHAKLARQLQMAIYFAKPYCAWQRGTTKTRMD